MWDNYERVNRGKMGITEKKEQKKTHKKCEPIMTDNFPKLMSETNHRSRKFREHQAMFSTLKKNLHLGISYLNYR